MCVCYGGMKKSNKKVFISREIASDNPLRYSLEEKGYRVNGQSLITFKSVPFTQYPASDWIFFYSSRAASFFKEGLKKSGQKWPQSPKLAAMGEGTAKWLNENQSPPAFVGTGQPKKTAEAFLQLAAGQKVLFPRANASLQSIQTLLGRQINALDLVVYHNSPKRDFPLPIADILVFTSPMNVQAYFHRFSIKADQRIISIGATTTAALVKAGIKVDSEAKGAGEQWLVRAILEINEV